MDNQFTNEEVFDYVESLQPCEVVELLEITTDDLIGEFTGHIFENKQRIINTMLDEEIEYAGE